MRSSNLKLLLLSNKVIVLKSSQLRRQAMPKMTSFELLSIGQ